MGFWDSIFGKDKRQHFEPKDFSELFDLASRDEAYRPLFYEKILKTKLYILIDMCSELPAGKFKAPTGTTLNVKLLADGRIPIFTSIDKIFDNNVIQSDERYVAMDGKAIFEMFKTPTAFLLDPYSRPSKEFLPDEIIRLLAGQLFQPAETYTVKEGTITNIGTPANFPEELAGALKRYCTTRKKIYGAYLAMIHHVNTGEPPHLIVGIDLKDDDNQVFGEIGAVIKPYLSKGEPLDMISVSSNGITSKVLKQPKYRIY